MPTWSRLDKIRDKSISSTAQKVRWRSVEKKMFMTCWSVVFIRRFCLVRPRQQSWWLHSQCQLCSPFILSFLSPKERNAFPGFSQVISDCLNIDEGGRRSIDPARNWLHDVEWLLMNHRTVSSASTKPSTAESPLSGCSWSSERCSWSDRIVMLLFMSFWRTNVKNKCPSQSQRAEQDEEESRSSQGKLTCVLFV